ncbi:MAG: hypothetical protein A3I60_00420 [Sulfuricurvum sp. RIFCSPLOWO2_02_FULL_43_45]|nr:MAG: hypothetical protein A3I60_00420 [Sulfuricurvum sp. RIFCSPLOWO2_02_FULL_43_45]
MLRLILPLLISVVLYAQSITLADLAFIVSKKDNVSIIFSGDVSKTMIIDFPNGYNKPSYLPLFKTILSANNLSYKENDGFFIVSIASGNTESSDSVLSVPNDPILKAPPPLVSSALTISNPSDSSLSSPDQSQQIDYNISFVSHKLDYLQFDNVKPLLDFSAIPYSFATVSKTITFKQNKKNKELIKKLIDEIKLLDVKKDQVTLKITIYDSNSEKIREVGIDPSISFDFSLLSQSGAILSGDAVGAFKGSLKLLSSKGAANVSHSTSYVISDGDLLDFKKVVSLPFLDENFALTTDNGTNQSKKYKYRDVGFKILATPTLVGDTCYLDFSLSIGSVLSSGDLPTTSENSIKNRFSIRRGEILLLAGVSKESLLNDSNSAPFLEDIPILGDIFTHKSKTDSNEYFNVSIEIL